jgi:hypothetical protein
MAISNCSDDEYNVSAGRGQKKPNNHHHHHQVDGVDDDDEDETSNESRNFLRFNKQLANVTRDAGSLVRLRCEAEGIPPPKTIKWYKNGVQDQLKGDRFRITSKRKKYVCFAPSVISPLF